MPIKINLLICDSKKKHQNSNFNNTVFCGKYNFYLYEYNTTNYKMSDLNKRATSPNNITNENRQSRNNNTGK